MSALSPAVTQTLVEHLTISEAYAENYQGICKAIENTTSTKNHICDVSLSVLGDHDNIQEHPIFRAALANNQLEPHQIKYILDEVFSHTKEEPLDPEVAAFFKDKGFTPPTIIQLKNSTMSTIRHVGGNVANNIYITKDKDADRRLKVTSDHVTNLTTANLAKIVTEINKLDTIPNRATRAPQDQLSAKDKLACGIFLCDITLGMFEAGHIDAASLPEIIKLKSLFTENKESIAILHTASKTWPIQALAA